MNPVEWLIYAAATELRRSDGSVWLALPLRVRQACGAVVAYGVRVTHPIDLAPLLAALRPR